MPTALPTSTTQDWQRMSYKALLNHTNVWSGTGGVDTNYDVTVDYRGAAEIGEKSTG